MRVKCIDIHPGDPALKKKQFYEVECAQIFTIADETPYIRIKISPNYSVDRPRHLFGPLLFDEKSS